MSSPYTLYNVKGKARQGSENKSLSDVNNFL